MARALLSLLLAAAATGLAAAISANVSLVPYPNCTKIIGATFCYEGAEVDVITAGRLDPLTCKIAGFEAHLLRGNCSAAGFNNYKGNDPVFKKVGLWFKEASSPSIIPTSEAAAAAAAAAAATAAAAAAPAAAAAATAAAAAAPRKNIVGDPTVGSVWTLGAPLDSAPGTLVATFINVSSGAETPAGELNLETVLPHADGCMKGRWNVAQGTRGQGNTMFRENATLFFLAVEYCAEAAEDPDGISRVVLLGVMEPHPPWGVPAPPPPPLQLRLPYGLPYHTWNRSSSVEGVMEWGLERWNIMWDHVCNIIVLAPSGTQATNLLTHQTLMVSEFDAQVRPQAPYSTGPAVPDQSRGWASAKLDGVAAIQYDGHELGWPDQGNCGSCPVFTVEGHYWDGNQLPQRFIIGRSFHDAKLVANVSDTLGLETLSVDPRRPPDTGNAPPRHFVGLGLCCDPQSQQDCDQACVGHVGELVLLAYAGDASNPPYFLAYLDDYSVAAGQPPPRPDHETSIRLGVLLQQHDPYGPHPALLAHIMGGAYANNTHLIQSFTLTSDDATGVVSVKNKADDVQLRGDVPGIWQTLRD
jgi:hypothetical protein